jgi:hypothetical protein
MENGGSTRPHSNVNHITMAVNSYTATLLTWFNLEHATTYVYTHVYIYTYIIYTYVCTMCCNKLI